MLCSTSKFSLCIFPEFLSTSHKRIKEVKMFQQMCEIWAGKVWHQGGVKTWQDLKEWFSCIERVRWENRSIRKTSKLFWPCNWAAEKWQILQLSMRYFQSKTGKLHWSEKEALATGILLVDLTGKSSRTTCKCNASQVFWTNELSPMFHFDL